MPGAWRSSDGVFCSPSYSSFPPHCFSFNISFFLDLSVISIVSKCSLILPRAVRALGASDLLALPLSRASLGRNLGAFRGTYSMGTEDTTGIKQNGNDFGEDRPSTRKAPRRTVLLEWRE